MLGVAVWAEEDPAAKAKEFVEQHSLTFPVLVDTEDSVTKTYGVQGVPTNIVIGKDGKVVYVEAGFNEEGVKQAMEEAMK